MNRHHDLIRSLIAEIRRLRNEVDCLEGRVENQEDYASSLWRQEQATARAAQRARDAAYEAEQAQRNAEYRQDEITKELRDLERAEQWGNRYAAEHARDRIRRYS